MIVWTPKAKSLRQRCDVCGHMTACRATGEPYAVHVRSKKHQDAITKAGIDRRDIKPENVVLQKELFG